MSNSKSLYLDGGYLDRNPTWHAEDSAWKAAQIERMLRRHQLAPRTICEVGCGAGEILRSLADTLGTGVEFSGYEISPQAFEICSRKVQPNLRFYREDLLTKADRLFDLVMAIDVFEHVEDYLGFLRKLRTKGEYKIFHVPLELSVQTVLRASPLMRGRALVGHLHYFTKETALASLHDTGYEVVDWVYTRGAIERPGGGWKPALLKAPRRMLFAIHQDLTVRMLGGFSMLVLAR